MASPASLPSSPQDVPAADPAAIRAALTPALLAEFDQEWAIVLDRAKESHELTGVFDLLNKWQHIVVMERRSPGTYFGLLAKAEQILQAGGSRESVSIEDHRAAIQQRLQAG
ncbi:hypothetical protein H0264_15110 [Nocardia huaxiensis]|uniref:Uncharacterized protein n=1 Tax=Nocardia huaxiensis TaxID=2755382 RepID=A0A7D6ZGP7_9NOCA|nr:DUF6247 family protein [Nocardia huaxiensis]QLY33378.1 hypothetical protein H0264_15110 [Nocardia huaxiensis]